MSINPNDGDRLIVKFEGVGSSNLEDAEAYTQLDVPQVTWGRVFVHTDNVDRFGGLQKITNYVVECISNIPVREGTVELVLHLDAKKDYSQSSGSTEGASSSSSSEAKKISKSKSSSTKNTERIRTLNSWLDNKLFNVLSHFDKPVNTTYLKGGIIKIAKGLSRQDLMMESEDELVTKIKKTVLVPVYVQIIAQILKKNGQVAAEEELTEYVKFIIFNLVNLDLNMYDKMKVTPDQIYQFNEDIKAAILETINETFLMAADPDNFMEMKQNAYTKPAPDVVSDDPVTNLSFKREAVLKLLAEKSQKEAPKLRELRKMLVSNLDDYDVTMLSVEGLRDLVNEKIKEMRKSGDGEINFLSKKRHIEFDDARTEVKPLKSIIEPDMAKLANQPADNEISNREIWVASQKVFRHLLHGISRGRELDADARLLASYLDDVMSLLPMDSIRTLADLKQLLIFRIINSNVVVTDMDYETFKDLYHENAEGSIPPDVRNAFEYARAKKDFDNGEWTEGMSKRFTLMRFDSKKLLQIVREGKAIDIFFNDPDVKSVLSQYLNLELT